MSENQSSVQTALLSPFMESLHGRRLLVNDMPERGHLLMVYGMLHQRFGRKVAATLQLIEAEEVRRRKEGFDKNTSGDPLAALESFQDAVYRAAEIFEFYRQDVPKYLGILDNPEYKSFKEKYYESINKARRTWDVLCNKCKHEHAFLIPVEGYYSEADWVTGFSLVRCEGYKIFVEKNFHKGADAWSYNRSLKLLLSDIINADMAAATLVSQLKDNGPDSLSALSLPLPYMGILGNLVKKPRIFMPKEGNLGNIDVRFVGETIDLTYTQVAGDSRDFTMRIIVNIMGNQFTFVFPYLGNEAQMKTNEQFPIPGFRRIVFGGLTIQGEK